MILMAKLTPKIAHASAKFYINQFTNLQTISFACKMYTKEINESVLWNFLESTEK